ncbi:fragile X mental retardation syndrome-related protein 2-like isoform X4 [Megalobrama amblycephala]|uniref:fragile X mental retardation syndrome-related protein 2-like isoform X4 n=1 Tax=Megalobrama amblycephala TaxID=75352 RepID=UPI0020140EE2|nr:fragile X mental retardation syndrome-related protein 2-like isoform X4 [Megalobrama amblycephala]
MVPLSNMDLQSGRMKTRSSLSPSTDRERFRGLLTGSPNCEEEGRPQRRNRSRRRRNRGNRPEGGSTSRDRQPVTVADFISRADSQSRQNLSGKEESTQHVSRPKHSLQSDGKARAFTLEFVENGTSTSKEERTPSKRSPSNGVPSSGETVALVNGVS